MEYIMLLGALLLILGLLMVIFLGQYGQQSLVVQNRLAEHTLTILEDEARQVWMEGAGAEHKVLVDFPLTTDLNRSNISGHVIQLYMLGQGDVSRSLPFNVSGTWTSSPGRAYMSVYNNGSMVLVRPAGLLAVNVTGVYLAMASGAGNSTTLGITNAANSSTTLSQALYCPTLASCTYGGGNGTLGAGGQQTASLSISSNSIGLWTGHLDINATPASGSDLPNETFVIPITIKVY